MDGSLGEVGSREHVGEFLDALVGRKCHNMREGRVSGIIFINTQVMSAEGSDLRQVSNGDDLQAT